MNTHSYNPNHPAHNATVYQYAGFWVRLAAQLIDGVLWLLVSLPILYLVYGDAYFGVNEPPVVGVFFGVFDALMSLILPIVLVVVFWLKKGATPGKMLFGLKVLDSKTGNHLTLGQAILRYFGYFLSGLVFALGYIWAAFDKKKQGWHDKLAKTVVVRER